MPRHQYALKNTNDTINHTICTDSTTLKH